MEEAGTGKQRSAVLLLILLLHGLIIEALIRNSKETELTKTALSDALLIYFLPQNVSPVIDAPGPEDPSKLPRKSRVLDRKMSPGLARAVPIAPLNEAAPAVPPIDWQAQLELAAKNIASDAERRNAYRDLSKSMTPSQLDWLKHNHMELANPGITWKKPRIEVSKDGLPIVHINDHCVLVPIFLIPMVFCSIGHIEPNGDLFKHMHDPPLP